MELTPENFNLSCNCGREHTVTIKKLLIEEGALCRLHSEMEKLSLAGKVTAVYDENTKKAVSGYSLAFDSEVVLSPGNLHADEKATAWVMERLDNPDVLVAIGAGTVHDVTRWCANELGIPFVSCPTAASVDGFCSSVSAMTWYGYKKTMSGIAPLLVVADTKVLADAPLRLTLSGVGDMVGKYISLADWKIGRLLTGEYYCSELAKMTFSALAAVRDNAAGLLRKDTAAYEKLIYGLLLSGVSMQLAGNSRPASGAEHHISHFVEMGVVGVSDALHGEKVGVGTVIASGVYHATGKRRKEDIGAAFRDQDWILKQSILPIFGGLSEDVLEENRENCLGGIGAELVADHWVKLRGIIDEIPSTAEIQSLLRSLGVRTTLAEIGIDEGCLPTILHYSPMVRNRLTAMRVFSAFGLLE